VSPFFFPFWRISYGVLQESRGQQSRIANQLVRLGLSCLSSSAHASHDERRRQAATVIHYSSTTTGAKKGTIDGWFQRYDMDLRVGRASVLRVGEEGGWECEGEGQGGILLLDCSPILALVRPWWWCKGVSARWSSSYDDTWRLDVVEIHFETWHGSMVASYSITEPLAGNALTTAVTHTHTRTHLWASIYDQPSSASPLSPASTQALPLSPTAHSHHTVCRTTMNHDGPRHGSFQRRAMHDIRQMTVPPSCTGVR